MLHELRSWKGWEKNINVLKGMSASNSNSIGSNEKFKKEDNYEKANASHYKSLIGCLLYLATIQLDIIYATTSLLRFMQNSTQIH